VRLQQLLEAALSKEDLDAQGLAAARRHDFDPRALGAFSLDFSAESAAVQSSRTASESHTGRPNSR